MKFSTNKEKGNTYKTLIDTKIDELFIVADNLDIYILPIEKIYNKSTLNLCNKYQKYNYISVKLKLSLFEK